MNTNKANTIENGMAILIDLERKIYAMNPAIKHAIAVRVPEGNIPQKHAIPTVKKKNLCFLIFEVIPKMMKATAVEAIPIP